MMCPRAGEMGLPSSRDAAGQWETWGDGNTVRHPRY